MKALRIYKDAITKVEDIQEPVVGDTDVKIRVKACGICGSDVPRVLNNMAHYYPIILGHEFSGIVADKGKLVSDINVGDAVVGAPLVPCYECADCLAGNYSLCKHYTFIGSRLPGAMAEYVVVPAKNVLKIPKTLDFNSAAMIEPLTVVLHAMKQNNHIAGKRVAVLGMGTIGCLASQAIKTIGASNITAVVRNKKYDDLIEVMNLDSTIDTSNPNWLEKAMEITNGRGFDFVYETAGSVETMQQAFELVGNKGHVCLIGTPKNELTFSVKMWELLNRKEFYLTGSWMSYSAPFPGEEWTDAVKFLESGEIKVYPAMWHKKTLLKESGDVFEDYKISGRVKGRSLIVMG